MSEITNNQHTAGAAGAAEVRYAGLWSRFCASFLDGILVTVFYVGTALVIMAAAALSMAGSFAWNKLLDAESWPLGVQLLTFSAIVAVVIMTLAYEPFFIGRSGQTPGRKAMGIRVVRVDGERVGYGKALLRTVCKGLFYNLPFVGAPTLLVSVGFVVFHSKKQSLHDLACKTVTVANSR